MGWGIPAEEFKYVMMTKPALAPNLGTWYTIEWHQFAGTALGVQGLAARTLDCATVGSLSAANGIEQGASMVFTGGIMEERSSSFSTVWLARPDSGISSLNDIRGKTMSTIIGGGLDYLAESYIKSKTGLSSGKDYKKVNLPFAQAVDAFLNGQVDLGVFPQPFASSIMARTSAVKLFNTAEVLDPFVNLLNACRTDFVADNPGVMKKFMQDWSAIATWVRDPANRDEVVSLTAQATKLPKDLLAPYLMTDKDYERPENGAIDTAALQRQWDFMNQAGALKKALKVDDYLAAGVSRTSTSS